jgi:hypothetical protein
MTQNQYIINLVYSPNDYLLVEGDIHKSQYIASNKSGNYWFKVKGYINDELVPELASIHIFVCWRKYVYDYATKGFVLGKCINPKPYYGTDIPDISRLKGYWEYVDITFGHTNIPVYNTNTNNVIKKESKKLDIINPKTNKVIKGGKIRKHKGINQKTGKLKKGYKYSGKKLKSGLREIIKK